MSVTITHVETTQDLSTAKVYFTEIGEEEQEADELLDALQKTENFFRSELSGLGLRRVPRLVFSRDREYESGQRVLNILAGLDVGESGQAEQAEPSEDSDSNDGSDSDPAAE